MSKTAYHLQLKGLIGGANFDRKSVDNNLEKNPGKQADLDKIDLNDAQLNVLEEYGVYYSD